MPLKKIYAVLEKHPESNVDWVLGHTLKAARYKVKKKQQLRQPKGDADSDDGRAPRRNGKKGKQMKRKALMQEAESILLSRDGGKRQKHKKFGDTISFD